MKWEFATDISEDQKLRISCEGKLTLTGDGDGEVCATSAPSDMREAEDEIRLLFDGETRVAVPEGVDIVVENAAGELHARKLRGGLTIERVSGDARIEGHEGGIDVRQADQELRLRGVQGGVKIHSVAGDLSVKGSHGGVHVESCAGDCAVTGLSGGFQIESVAGDFVLVGHSGGVQAQSIAGDAAIKAMSGGLQLEDVAGDVHVTGSSGGLSFGDVGGECQIKGTSGGIRARHVASDLRIIGVSGSAEAERVGGDLVVEKTSGDLSFDRVEGQARLCDVKTDSLQITAVGDVTVQGEAEGEATWKLTSDTGSVTVALPEGTEPLLSRAEAGGEVACELDAGEGDLGPELVLSAAENIRVSAYETKKRRRSRRARRRRHVTIPIPDVDQIISDVFEPFSRQRKREPQDLREERLRVLKMIEAGKVNAEEGARLLEALGDR